MISAHQHLPLLPTTLVNITTQGAHQELDRLYISLRLAEDKTKNPNDLSIEAALKMTGDNRATAAEMLGLSRQSLYAKLRRHGLGDLGSDEE